MGELLMNPAIAVAQIVSGMRLQVETSDGTVHTVPIDLDFSTLDPDDTELGLSMGGGNPGRVAAAFVALKANQTLHLSEEDLAEVVDVLSGFLDGDESNFILHDGPDGGVSALVRVPDLSPAGSEALSG